jgi:hypothetical protein
MPSVPDPPAADESPSGRPAFIDDAYRPLLAALGINPNAPRWWARTTEPLRSDRGDVPIIVLETTQRTPAAWHLTGIAPADADRQGVRVEWSGSTVPRIPPPYPWPVIELPDPSGQLHFVRCWRVRVWVEGSPLWAEHSHLPSARGEVIVGGWLDGPWHSKDAQRVPGLVRVLGALDRAGRGGRQTGDRYFPTPRDYLTELWGKVLEPALERPGHLRSITARVIARKLTISEAQVHIENGRASIDMAAIKRGSIPRES